MRNGLSTRTDLIVQSTGVHLLLHALRVSLGVWFDEMVVRTNAHSL